jgi:UDPglucose 6-dehydrogenase
MSGDEGGAKLPIGVVGVGWVGLVTAACFAEMGHRVVARDIVPEKIESLNAGEVPIHEPGLPELLQANAERLTFTTDLGEVLEHAGLVFVAVETPPTASGDADLTSVMTAIDEVSGAGDHAVVMTLVRSFRSAPGARSVVSSPASPTSPTRSSCARGRRYMTSCTPTES